MDELMHRVVSLRLRAQALRSATADYAAGLWLSDGSDATWALRHAVAGTVSEAECIEAALRAAERLLPAVTTKDVKAELPASSGEASEKGGCGLRAAEWLLPTAAKDAKKVRWLMDGGEKPGEGGAHSAAVSDAISLSLVKAAAPERQPSLVSPAAQMEADEKQHSMGERIERLPSVELAATSAVALREMGQRLDQLEATLGVLEQQSEQVAAMSQWGPADEETSKSQVDLNMEMGATEMKLQMEVAAMEQQQVELAAMEQQQVELAAVEQQRVELAALEQQQVELEQKMDEMSLEVEQQADEVVKRMEEASLEHQARVQVQLRMQAEVEEQIEAMLLEKRLEEEQVNDAAAEDGNQSLLKILEKQQQQQQVAYDAVDLSEPPASPTLLQEMAAQAVNKLARAVIPNLTPYSAHGVDIQYVTEAAWHPVKLRAILAEYPLFKVGVCGGVPHQGWGTKGDLQYVVERLPGTP